MLDLSSLAMEWTPTQRRTLVNTYAMYMITLGQVILSGLAYFIRQWRWLQGTVSVTYVIILLYSWYVSSRYTIYCTELPGLVCLHEECLLTSELTLAWAC